MKKKLSQWYWAILESMTSMFADPDDPEYVRQMRRPAEVKEDIRQMEQRKRVDLIMQVYSMS